MCSEGQSTHSPRNLTGAASGHLGAKHGEKGKMYGAAGGRPAPTTPIREFGDDPQPGPRLKKDISPQKLEPTAASAQHFQVWIKQVLEKRGMQEQDANAEFFRGLQGKFFRGRKTRDLVRLWNDKEKKADRVEELELGQGGGRRKKGEHSVHPSDVQS